ncbi:MAG: hypothetical protein ACI9OD_005113, partial [Limisphaerales bacterium]
MGDAAQSQSQFGFSSSGVPCDSAVVEPVSHNLFFLLAFLITFPGGRIDSQKLWDELVIRRQEKAYVHGH